MTDKKTEELPMKEEVYQFRPLDKVIKRYEQLCRQSKNEDIDDKVRKMAQIERNQLAWVLGKD
jgi:hypothetical protein